MPRPLAAPLLSTTSEPRSVGPALVADPVGRKYAAHPGEDVSRQSLSPDTVWVEDLSATAAAAYVLPWRGLGPDCLEPNAFFEPDFALAAVPLAGPRLRFIFVWAGAARQRGSLLAVLPLMLPHAAMPLPLAHVWLHKNTTSSTPWLARAQAEPALRAALAHCRSRWPRLVGLCIGRTAVEGPFVKLLDAMDLPARLTNVFARAVIDRASAEGFVPAGHRTLAKARRRLERQGAVTFHTASGRAEVGTAVEAFLALEAAGWKAGRGAFASRPDLALFARTATTAMAASGRCRIVSLALDGRPIAMGLVLLSAGRAFFWKIAYDETCAAYSPGALLSLALTEALIRDDAVASADSCADADHPMIDKLWPDRLAVGTCFVALGTRPAFAAAVGRELLWHRARSHLKAAVHRLRRGH